MVEFGRLSYQELEQYATFQYEITNKIQDDYETMKVPETLKTNIFAKKRRKATFGTHFDVGSNN